MRYYDGLETQTSEQRAAYIAEALPAQIAHAKQLPGYADRLAWAICAGKASAI